MHIIDKGLFSSNIKSFYKFKETDQINNCNQNKEKEERESKGTSSSEKKNSFLKI